MVTLDLGCLNDVLRVGEELPSLLNKEEVKASPNGLNWMSDSSEDDNGLYLLLPIPDLPIYRMRSKEWTTEKLMIVVGVIVLWMHYKNICEVTVGGAYTPTSCQKE